MITLAAFDELSRNRAVELMQECCASSEWAERMARGRPFASLDALYQQSDDTWWHLRKDDWLEAFRAHPKLGDASRKSASRSAGWSRGEQAAIVADASAAEELQRLNAEYEKKFGWQFILCATGKNALDVKASVTRRMENDEASELREAAEEQHKITRLRLDKLFEPPTVAPIGGPR